jgi:hypothetical protein
MKARICFIRRPCFLGAPGDTYKKALEKGISFRKVPVRYLEVVSFAGDFERHERGLWKRIVSLYWSWWEGFFARNS